MKFNPFQPNKIVAPGMFTGRTNEISLVERALFQAKNKNPTHFLIEGERGIGKSSLLFLVSCFANGDIEPLEAPKMKFLVVSIELGSVSSQIEIAQAIARQLKSEIQRINQETENMKKVWDFLSNWEVFGVKYNKSNITQGPESIRDELADKVAEFCKGSNFDGIFLVIDEADAPSHEANLGEFLKYFTERLSRLDCDNVLFGLAGLPTLIDKLRMSHESSPRIFSVINLETLNTEDRKQVVKTGLDQANEKNPAETTITDAALELLAELSEGYPHFIQQFAYSAFEADDDGTIDEKDVINGAYDDNGAIAQLGIKYFNDLYFGRINSDEYRKVLDAMAEHGDDWVTRETILHESEVKETTISNALGALKSREIIFSDASRRGYYRLPTKSFAAWIKAIKSVQFKKGGPPVFTNL